MQRAPSCFLMLHDRLKKAQQWKDRIFASENHHIWRIFERYFYFPLSWLILLFRSLFCLISHCISVVLVAPCHPTLIWDTVQHLASIWRVLEQVSRQRWGNARHQWRNTRHDSSLVSASSLIVAHLTASDLILPPAHHCTLPFSVLCTCR